MRWIGKIVHAPRLDILSDPSSREGSHQQNVRFNRVIQRARHVCAVGCGSGEIHDCLPVARCVPLLDRMFHRALRLDSGG